LNGKEKQDITFGYEANFFLYASLELARPMAHGRNHPAPSQPPPVLTGMPVSGMAYLDRPVEAGYFIFPDLSVRHEGRYKLAFNLYEQTKKDQDLDAEPSPQSQQNAPNGPHDADSSFDFRMEVKSDSFHVWSAKKFPGLKESTVLSRTVAEQGCRVRIRRDVRMRRRGGDGKGTDFDEPVYDEYARNRAEESDRASPSRSHTSGSESPPAHPHGQPYYQSQPGNNLSFIPGNANSQFAAPPPPPQHFAQQPPPHQQQIQQQPPPHRYPPQQQLYSQPPPPVHNNSYPHDRQHPQSAYPASSPRENFEPEHRRASVPYPSTNPREFPSMDSGIRRAPPPPQQEYAPRPYNGPSQNPVNIAPIKFATPIDPKYNQPALASVTHIVPEYPNPPRDRSGSYNSYPIPAAPEPARVGGKRAYDTVFKTPVQSLHNGMRPIISIDNNPEGDDDDDATYTSELYTHMSYRRADGNLAKREPPSQSREAI